LIRQDNDQGRASAVQTIRVGVIVLAAVAAGFAFRELRNILAPLALAVFLLLMIDGLARALGERTPFPKRAAMPAAVVLIVAMFAFAIWIMAHNGRGFALDAPTFAHRIDALLLEAKTRFGLQVPPTLGDLVHRLNPARWLGAAANAAGGAVEQFVFVLIYLGFLLASQHGFNRKLEAMLTQDTHQQEAARVMERVRRGVESYIFVQTVVGVVIAGMSLLIMWPMGLKHMYFFAFLIFVANYVPAIGAAIGVLVPPLFALLQFDDLWRPLGMLVAFELIHFGVSHVLQPRLQGKQLNLDPIFVLLGLAFWGYLWGLTGAFLSTPLTVTVMALLAEQPSMRWIAVLLSSDGKPFADESHDAVAAEPEPQPEPQRKPPPAAAAS
jgi:predicted PurR-regulated permease PerM